MRAFHDTRQRHCRFPFGAIAAGTSVALTLDVEDAPGATVSLRTWVDGTGETIYEMTSSSHLDGEGEADTPSGIVRYQAHLTPEAAGVVWYHFVITEADGNTQRYGALPGRTGGTGQLGYGEPPSFQLTVYDPDALAGRDPAEFNHTNGLSFDIATARFLCGELSAPELIETRETLRESCPPPLVNHALDLLGSENRTQFLLWLAQAVPAGAPAPADLAFSDLDDGRRGLAKGRFWCASLIQALMPGAPSAPLGQIAAAWGDEDADCETIVRNAVDLRDSLPLFASDTVAYFAPNEDVMGFWRWAENENVPGHNAQIPLDTACERHPADALTGQNPSTARGNGAKSPSSPSSTHPQPREAACVLVNRSLSAPYDIPIALTCEEVSEIIAGYRVPLVGESELDASVPSPFDSHLPTDSPADSADTNGATPAVTNQFAQAHLTQLGSAALYFHPAQQRGLPMEPGLGVLAHITSVPANQDGDKAKPGTLGEPARRFVDWLAQAGVRYWQVLPVNPTDEFGSPYAGISAFAGNLQLIEGDVGTVADDMALGHPDEYHAFCKREADWLEPYACFMAIRQKLGAGKPWQDWPKKYRQANPELISSDAKLSASAESWRRRQFAFEQQWRDLRAYANERGVQIIGDMPIYVSADSADVWAHPNIFQLDASGRPAQIAGCPPDSFASEGQIWGNPVYDWDALRESDYAWWLRRLEHAFDLYDIVRLDHFIGFARYFAIPVGEKATAGSYHPGPGLDFFERAHARFGALPIIAEDLGLITPAVRALVAACGFPGMDVVQFADGNDPLSGYGPRPGKIAYTGTHDNQTLRGYVHDRYPAEDELACTERLLEMVTRCDADVRIVALQDVLLLGDGARMNVPGVAEGNWTWQASREELEEAYDRLKRLAASR